LSESTTLVVPVAAARKTPVEPLFERVRLAELERARLWYEPHLERIHEDAVTRRADLIQLEQIAGGYPSRERFLTELTLDPPDATSDLAGVQLLDEDYLILSTIHSAKGREWKSVFVLNVVDGCIPSDLGTGTSAEIEEERRLLYVAMTRAKDDLHLIVPQRFFMRDAVAALKNELPYSSQNMKVGCQERLDHAGGSGSGRSLLPGRRTSISLATPVTPETRFASRSACHL
jgi:superfamily I DNA/RNA helicase